MTSPERQLEEQFKTLGINPRRAIEQIVEHKNDPGSGYTRTPSDFAAFGWGN